MPLSLLSLKPLFLPPRKFTGGFTARAEVRSKKWFGYELETEMANWLKSAYLERIFPALLEEFTYKNLSQVPKISRIVVNCGLGDDGQSARGLDIAVNDMTLFAGQRPVKAGSKNVFAHSNNRANQPLGLSVTLRGNVKCVGSFPLLSHLFLHQKRSTVCISRGNFSTAASVKWFESDPAPLKSALEDIKDLVKTQFCHPILVRLGWHDAGTCNQDIREWPEIGGANGSLRFEVEQKHAANAGLVNALKLLQPTKDKYTDAGPPSPAAHLRDGFYRMGLNDKEIVALSGADTLGGSRLKFQTCRLLQGNVWKKELTIIQRRILRRLRKRKRSINRRIHSRKNLNSYIQLQTTRKLALFYGDLPITEMHRRGKGTSYIPFLLNLERRLDVTLVRIHFCESLPQARLLISHRKVCVNQGIVCISHFKVSHGDIISFQENEARTRGEEIRRYFYTQILVEKRIGKFLDRPIRVWRRIKSKWYQKVKTKTGCRKLLKDRFLRKWRSSMRKEDFEKTKKLFYSKKGGLRSNLADYMRKRRNLYHFQFLSNKRKDKRDIFLLK